MGQVFSPFPEDDDWAYSALLFFYSGRLPVSYLFQLAERQGFRGAQFVDVEVSLHVRNSSYLRERDKML